MANISQHLIQKQIKQQAIDSLIAHCVTEACAKMDDLRKLSSEIRPKCDRKQPKAA